MKANKTWQKTLIAMIGLVNVMLVALAAEIGRGTIPLPQWVVPFLPVLAAGFAYWQTQLPALEVQWFPDNENQSRGDFHKVDVSDPAGWSPVEHAPQSPPIVNKKPPVDQQTSSELLGHGQGASGDTS